MGCTLLKIYHEAVDNQHLEALGAQKKLVSRLQCVLDSVVSKKSLKYYLLKLFRKNHLPYGFYLWGSVGTGKTTIMDLTCHALPAASTLRMHFHRFMQGLHAGLEVYKAEEHPLDLYIQALCREIKVLCLDEFLVEDIVDAMIIKDVLTALNKARVFLFTTSNTPPQNLYLKGLQRKRFLPAIDYLNTKFEIHNLSGDDFRETFDHAVLATAEACQARFEMEGVAHPNPGTMRVFGRIVEFKAKAKQAIWFDFEQILLPPRNKKDFLWLADHYPLIIISGLRVIGAHETNLAYNFIQLVDVAYDAGTRLMLDSNLEMDAIYPEGIAKDNFKRCVSRLNEMQSAQYGQVPKSTL